MDCTQILVESDEETSATQEDNRRQVALLKTNGDSYPILVGENRIGRDPKTCSIVFDNMALSGQHAIIEGREGGPFLIYDLNSRNKTRIGKMPLTPQVRYQLKNGEILRFADMLCTFCITEGIKLRHVSLDDDEPDTSVTVVDTPKTELPATVDISSEQNVSVEDEEIFEKNTEVQSSVLPEKIIKVSSETEDPTFKMPGPSSNKNMNSSIVSLNKSDVSSIDVYDDDIFDLPTQPYFRETESGNQDDKEDSNQKDKGGGAIVLEAISSPEDSNELEQRSDQSNAQNDSEIGKNILDSIFSIKTEKKLEENESEESKKKSDRTKYSWDEKIDKFGDDEDTDDDGIFSAATALFIREDNSKKYSEESKKTIESSAFKEEKEEGDAGKIDRSADETDPEDVFSSLSQEVTQRYKKAELKKMDDLKKDDIEKIANEKNSSTAVVGTSTSKTDLKNVDCKNNINKPKDTAEVDIFSVNTAPLPIKEKSFKQEEKDRCDASFEDGEDSDDDLFAAATEIQFPIINADKEKGSEREIKADSGISCTKDNIVPKENVSSPCEMPFKKEIKSVVEGSSRETGSGYAGDHLAKSNREKHDPDKKLELREIESKEVKTKEETENKANESLDVVMPEDKLKMIPTERKNVESNKEVDMFNISSGSPENSNQEKKFEVKDESVLESNKNQNDENKSEIENQNIHSPQLVHSDEDNDTDIEDICPPSVRKPSHSTMKLENTSSKGQNKSNSIEKPTLLLTSDAKIKESFGSTTGSSDNDLVFRELSRNTPNKSDTSTGILANATMEEENEVAEAEEDQSECLVIMSDTDDEKEVEDSISESENVNESFDKQQSSKNILLHQDSKFILESKSDANGNISPKIEDKETENSNNEKLKKVSVSEVTKDKGKNGSLDVSDQKDEVNKITLDDGIPLKGNIDIKSDSEDENEDDVPKEQILEQDKSEVINLKEKEVIIAKEKTEKALSNDKLDSDSDKIDLKEPVTVNSTGKPLNKVEDESVNETVPSTDEHNVVDMTLDITLPVPRIRVLTEKRATSSLKDENVNIIQMKDILNKAAESDDKKGGHSQTKSLSSAMDKNADDFILTENKVASQLKVSNRDLDLLQKQEGEVKNSDDDNLNVPSVQSSLDSSKNPSEEISDEKDKLKSNIDSELDSKARDRSVSAANNSDKLGGNHIKIALDINPSEKNISEVEFDGSSPELKTSDDVVKKVCLDKDLGSTESKPSQSSEISKLPIEKVEERNDMSSSITQAPTDFQTPKAYLKTNLEDEEDISSLLTQAPPEFKTPEVTVKKLKDGGEELYPSENQSTPVKNSAKTLPEEIEAEEEDMSSFVTEVAPDFSTSKSLIEVEGSQDKEDDVGLSKVSFEMINSDEEDLSMMETQPPPGHKENDNLSALKRQSPPYINSPKEDMGKVNDNDDKMSLESRQVPSSKTSLMKNIVENNETKSILTKPPPNKSPELINKIDEDIDDYSLCETQPAPFTETLSRKKQKDDAAQERGDFKTPTSRVDKDDEDDMSMLATQPAPGSVTIQEKNDAKRGDTIQVTTDCATPKNVINTDEEDDDLSILQTQPAPTYKTTKRIEDVEDKGKLQTSSDFKVPKLHVEKDKNNDEDLSIAEAQKAPRGEVARKNKNILDIEMTAETTKGKASKSAVEIEENHEEDLSFLATQPAPQSDATNANEEDEDMTQAPVEFNDPNSAVKEEMKNKDLKLLETQSAPQSITANDNEDEDMTQAPTEFKAPESPIRKKENDEKDLSLLESKLMHKPEKSNANDDDEDLSLLATQPAPQSNSTNASEVGEDMTQSPADFKASKSAVEKVNDRTDGNEDDEDMTQAPAEYNLEQAVDVKVKINGKDDANSFDTQSAPGSINSGKASEKERDGKENAKSSLPKHHEDFKTSAIENISSDEEDLSNLDTQQAPTFKSPKSVQQKVNYDIEGISSSAKAQSEFKVPTATVENVTDDEDDLSSFETQPAPTLITINVNQPKIKVDTEKISSSSSKAQEEYKLPSVAIEDVTDDEEDLSNYETQPAPTYSSKKALEQKNKNITQNVSLTSIKAQQEYNLPSAVIEDVTDDEEDLSNCETQPVPTFITEKVLQQKNKNVTETISSSSAKAQPESKLPSIAIEDVTDDEDDLSSLDTQPAPVFQAPVSVNGKAKEVQKTDKDAPKCNVSSKIIKEVTPSRKSLRKSVLLKNEKESAKKASAVDKEKDKTGEEPLEPDDDSDVDIRIDLPDTPDLINTLNEYKDSKPRSSSNLCRNLFNPKKSDSSSENMAEFSNEVETCEISLKFTEIVVGKDQKQRNTRSKTVVADKDDVSDKKNANVAQKIACGDKIADNIRGKPKTLHSEMERRPPSTRNVDKQQALSKIESVPGTQLLSSKKQRLEKSESQVIPGNKRKFDKAFDKSPHKDEPTTKRKPKLEIKPIKHERVAVVEVKEIADDSNSIKPNLRGRRKLDVVPEKVPCDSTSSEGEVRLKMSGPAKNVHLKKMEEVKVQEMIPKRGRRNKKEQINELQMVEVKEEPIVDESIDTKKGKISSPILGKSRRTSVKEVKAVKESVSPEKKTRSSRSIDVSDLDNAASKTEEKVKIDEMIKRHSSPARKKSLRVQTKLNHPEVKELEIHKDSVGDSSRHSMEEDKKEISPVLFYGKHDRSSLKERKLDIDKDTTSPNFPPRKKRQQDVLVKASVNLAENTSTNVQSPSSKSPDTVRRSSRMRKPKRRFTLDKSPEDATRKRMKDEIEVPKSTSLPGQKRGRKRKADSKKVTSNSSTSSQEAIVSSPESISCISSDKKFEEKEGARSSKRCKLVQDDSLKVEDSTVNKEDKRGRRIAVIPVNSAPPSVSTSKEGNRGQKGSPLEMVSGIVGEVAKRGRRRSSASNEQPTPLISDTNAEVSTSQMVQLKTNVVGNTRTAGRRGRKKSTSPSKWIGQVLSSTPILSSNVNSGEMSIPQGMVVNEQNVAKRVGRRGRKKSSTPIDVVTALALAVEDQSEETGTNSSEVPKTQEESSAKGVPKRGRKKPNTPVKLTSPDIKKVDSSGTSQGEEVKQKEILGSSEVRRGRKRSSNSSEVSTVIIKEKPADAINISESKTSLGSRRTGSMSSRSSLSTSISETVGLEKSLRARNQKKKLFNVLFTGVSDPKLEQTVTRLGGSVVETPQECNILVTDRLRRTYKLLCAVARGIPIVTVQWLMQSSLSTKFLDPLDFLINDKLTEKRFDFALKTSLERAKLKPLLTGYSILATPSVLPPPEEVKGIVTCAGGEYVPSLSVLQKKIPEQLYVVSCADDSAVWEEYKELGIKKKPVRGKSPRNKGKASEEPSKVRIIGVEGLLVSVLRQKIDFESKMFSLC